MSESYEVGTRAWQADPTEGWVPSEVTEKLVQGDKIRLVFKLESGEVSNSSFDDYAKCEFFLETAFGPSPFPI
jgi:hypothetical protein